MSSAQSNYTAHDWHGCPPSLNRSHGTKDRQANIVSLVLELCSWRHHHKETTPLT